MGHMQISAKCVRFREVKGCTGYGKNFLYSGLHSVGVTEFEPPILGPSSKTVIQENMVISVDIPLHEAANAIHPHPTFSEMIGETLLKADGRPLHTR